jgi:hypothetical protein
MSRVANKKKMIFLILLSKKKILSPLQLALRNLFQIKALIQLKKTVLKFSLFHGTRESTSLLVPKTNQCKITSLREKKALLRSNTSKIIKLNLYLNKIIHRIIILHKIIHKITIPQILIHKISILHHKIIILII